MARLCPSNSNPDNVNPEILLSNKGLFERLLRGFQFYLRNVKDVFVVFVHQKLFPRKSLPELRQLSILGNGTRLSIIPVGRPHSVFSVHFLAENFDLNLDYGKGWYICLLRSVFFERCFVERYSWFRSIYWCCNDSCLEDHVQWQECFFHAQRNIRAVIGK